MAETELDQAIVDAQLTDKSHFVRQLCYIKNLYQGDSHREAGLAHPALVVVLVHPGVVSLL
jgi:hypothetical protein